MDWDRRPEEKIKNNIIRNSQYNVKTFKCKHLVSASFYKEGAPAVSNGNPLPFYIKKLYQDVQCLNKGQAKDYTNVVSSIHELSLINAL